MMQESVTLYTRFATPLSLSVTTGVTEEMVSVGVESSLRMRAGRRSRAIQAWMGRLEVQVKRLIRFEDRVAKYGT